MAGGEWLQRPPRRRRRSPLGAPPGTLIADPGAAAPVVRLMAYDGETLVEKTEVDPEALRDHCSRRRVTWIDVEGLADLELIRRLGALFGLHGLELEDVVNLHQRPKLEEYEDHLFIVARTGKPGAALDTEQISMFLGRDYLLTFQHRPGDDFEPVRQRIRKARGRLREMGPDYLAYALLDIATDAWFPVLETLGERMEALEDEALARPTASLPPRVHALKRDLLTVRRAVWPQREMLHALQREELAFVSERTRIYLRDCYDHAVQLLDMTETFREIAADLFEIYLSSVNARTNEIMRVLTVIATLFMPLTFIAGVYGMNFDRASPWNMPELGWDFGYLFSLALMAATAAGLLLWFRRKGWLGAPRSRSG
jgi:magnesium transporter